MQADLAKSQSQIKLNSRSDDLHVQLEALQKQLSVQAATITEAYESRIKVGQNLQVCLAETAYSPRILMMRDGSVRVVLFFFFPLTLWGFGFLFFSFRRPGAREGSRFLCGPRATLERKPIVR